MSPDHASLKDIRQMIDAVHNACVEIGECGRLMRHPLTPNMPLAMEFEMLEALASVCQLAGELASYYLNGFIEIENDKRIKRIERKERTKKDKANDL